MEDVVDTGTAKAFKGYIAHKSPFQFLSVLFQELADQVKNDWSHTVFIYGQVLLVIGEKLALFLLYRQCDLLGQTRNAALNVANKDAVQRFSQVRDAHF